MIRNDHNISIINSLIYFTGSLITFPILLAKDSFLMSIARHGAATPFEGIGARSEAFYGRLPVPAFLLTDMQKLCVDDSRDVDLDMGRFLVDVSSPGHTVGFAVTGPISKIVKNIFSSTYERSRPVDNHQNNDLR